MTLQAPLEDVEPLDEATKAAIEEGLASARRGELVTLEQSTLNLRKRILHTAMNWQEHAGRRVTPTLQKSLLKPTTEQKTIFGSPTPKNQKPRLQASFLTEFKGVVRSERPHEA